MSPLGRILLGLAELNRRSLATELQDKRGTLKRTNVDVVERDARPDPPQ